jgi:hypothetical protein
MHYEMTDIASEGATSQNPPPSKSTLQREAKQISLLNNSKKLSGLTLTQYQLLAGEPNNLAREAHNTIVLI